MLSGMSKSAAEVLQRPLRWMEPSGARVPKTACCDGLLDVHLRSKKLQRLVPWLKVLREGMCFVV